MDVFMSQGSFLTNIHLSYLAIPIQLCKALKTKEEENWTKRERKKNGQSGSMNIKYIHVRKLTNFPTSQKKLSLLENRKG